MRCCRMGGLGCAFECPGAGSRHDAVAAGTAGDTPAGQGRPALSGPARRLRPGAAHGRLDGFMLSESAEFSAAVSSSSMAGRRVFPGRRLAESAAGPWIAGYLRRSDARRTCDRPPRGDVGRATMRLFARLPGAATRKAAPARSMSRRTGRTDEGSNRGNTAVLDQPEPYQNRCGDADQGARLRRVAGGAEKRATPRTRQRDAHEKGAERRSRPRSAGPLPTIPPTVAKPLSPSRARVASAGPAHAHRGCVAARTPVFGRHPTVAPGAGPRTDQTDIGGRGHCLIRRHVSACWLSRIWADSAEASLRHRCPGASAAPHRRSITRGEAESF